MRSTLITRSLVRGVGIGATLAAGLLALSPGLAFAQSGTWNVDASGDWSLGSNWDPAVVPGNAAGDVVGLTNNITAARTVTIDTTSRTVGTLTIGDANNTHAFTLGASGGAGLTFNNGGSGAALTESGAIGDTVSTPVTLADNLTVTVGGSLGMSGVISQSGGTRSLTKTGAGGLSLTANNSYDGPTTIQGGTVSMTTSGNGGQTSPLGQSSAAAANLVINGGVLRWAGSSAASTDRLFTIGTGGATLDFSGAALGFTNTGTLGLSGADTARTLTLTGVNSTDSNILSFSIPDNGSGATTVTKAGTGRVTLAGDSTYTGVTNVTAGRLLVASANALGSTSGGTIVSTGAQMRLVGTVTVGAEALTLSGTGISGAEGALRVQGSSGDIATWGGAVTLNANSLVNAGAGLTLKIGPGSGTAINLQGNTLDYTGAGSHEVLGGIFGTGGINKRGTSTLTLSGSGNYSGATTLTDGKIVANATSALGSSPVTVAAGKSLELKGGFDVGGGLLTLNGESLTNVSGNNTYSGPVTAAASSRIFVTSGTLTLSNTISQSSPSNAITFSGDGVTLISGNLDTSLTSLDINAKASDVPTVILTGSNANFTGPVGVQKGTLQLGNGGTTGSLPVSGAFNIGSGARVIVKQSDTVTQGTDFSGTLNGLGGFTQAGSGTTILNLANSYTGTTNVNAGTLIINGNQAAATGAVTVANGATLGGSGIVGGAVTVNGILSPGNSPGILTVSSLDLIGGSTTRMQLIGAGNLAGTAGTDYDKLVISIAGGLRYGGILDLDFANTATFDDGTTFDLFGFTGSTLGGFGSVISSGRGSYGGLTFSGVGGVWTALFGSQQLTFSELTGQLRFTTNSAVPEIDPATGASALSLIAGVVALIEQRRRRTKLVA